MSRYLYILLAVLLFLVAVYLYFFRRTDMAITPTGETSSTPIFPLSRGAKGLEVANVQRYLNYVLTAPLRLIAEDGDWGANTEARFKLIFPDKTVVTKSDYDKWLITLNKSL